MLTPAAQAAYLRLIPDSDRWCSPLEKLIVCGNPNADTLPRTSAAMPRLTHDAFTFAPSNAGVRLLGEGWSEPELSGVWSQASRATLELTRPHDLAAPLWLGLELDGFAPEDGHQQRVELLANGRRLGRWSLPERQTTSLSALLPRGEPGSLTLEFRIEAPTRPRDRGLGEDARQLGVHLRRLEVRPAADWPRLTSKETRFGIGAEGVAMLGMELLSGAKGLAVSGLLNTYAGARVPLAPSRLASAATPAKRALAESRPRYRQARMLIALDRSLHDPKARSLLERYLRKGEYRWQVQRLLYLLGFKDRGEILVPV